MVKPGRKAAPAKARQTGAASTRAKNKPEKQQGVDVQVREALQSTLPDMLAQLMPDLVSAVSDKLRGPSQGPSVPTTGADEDSDDDVQVARMVRHHANELTGKSPNNIECESSDEEDDALTYTLSMDEVKQVAQQEYLDFSSMYSRYLKAPYSDRAIQQKGQNQPDVPLTEWVRMFCAFQAEHLRSHPKDGPNMPKYVDRIVRMANEGMNWQRFDTTYRQRRAKRLQRSGKRVRSWARNDLELYLSCSGSLGINQPREQVRTFARRLATPTTAMPAPPMQQEDGLQMKSGTCWRFQHGKGCDGSCLWPGTHLCYACGGNHPTKFCNGQNPAGQTGATPGKEGPFRSPEPQKEEGNAPPPKDPEPRDRTRTSSKKEKGDREAWHTRH